MRTEIHHNDFGRDNGHQIGLINEHFVLTTDFRSFYTWIVLVYLIYVNLSFFRIIILVEVIKSV